MNEGREGLREREDSRGNSENKGRMKVYFLFLLLSQQRQEFHVFLVVFTLGLIKDGDAFAHVVDYSLNP